jgi:hypothetical protein
MTIRSSCSTATSSGGARCFDWIVNLLGRRIEVYSGPGTDGYSTSAEFLAGEGVPVVIHGTTVGHVRVNDILRGRRTRRHEVQPRLRSKLMIQI